MSPASEMRPDPDGDPQAIDRPMVGFHQDEEGHWVAELACGHQQHVRHDPPWSSRPWTQTPEGRAGVLGQTLACRKCVQGAPRDWPVASSGALGAS